MWKILEAGQWRSPAFLKYIDLHKCVIATMGDRIAIFDLRRLETDLVVQAHVLEGDDEVEG